MSDREMYLGAMAGSYEGELPPPNTRSLKWMAKLLGQDVETEPVQSPEEAYLKAIYENGGGGGGNPNYVETITGTMANPWGSVDPATLQSAIIGNNATALLTVDASALGMGTAYLVATPFALSNIAFQAVGGYGSTSNLWSAALVLYGTTGLLSAAMILQNDGVVNVREYAQSISTSLTVIHHPLPSGS